jgi:predicted Ser/Thr protein kinase
MSDSSPRLSRRGAEAAEQLVQLWEQGQCPDVDAFLAQAGPLTPAQLSTVLRVDQRRRWESGERVTAEDYLLRHPALATDPEAVVDLIFNEFLLREQLGEAPSLADYQRRFPSYAAVLVLQGELHRALAAHTQVPSLADAASSVREALPSEVPTKTLPPGTAVKVGLLPEVFGRYRIQRMLGQGGMGVVYLAYDTQLERPVALKVPRMDARDDPDLLERFYREARTAATFAHPQLCPVYDVGRIDGVHYLTMPLLSGESLAVRLKRGGRLPQRAAVELALLIARALQAAHDAGVLHRDLKPANIMLQEDGKPVVMDFGLARRVSANDPRVTASGAILGTPGYCAPEQIGSDPQTLGPTCDVYGLGSVLYEMLTGRLPFQGSLHELLRQVLTQEPVPPSEHCPDLDPRLEAICLTALAKAPAERFPSMSAFAAALQAHLADAPLGAGSLPATRLHPAPTPRKARRYWPLLAGALAVVLGAMLLCWLLSTLGDPLPVGSRWSGKYKFRQFGGEGSVGNVTLTISERDGPHFRGSYASLNGAYEWLIAGTLDAGQVRWDFTQVVREEEPQGLVGKASVEGTCQGREMQLVYHEPEAKGGELTADMTLQREK